MYYLVTSAWIVVTAVCWIQGGREMPIAIGILGLFAQIGIWIFGIGYLGVATLGLLTVICMFSAPEIFFRGKL